MATKHDGKNKPWVSNYPPLKEWLDKIEAHCMHQASFGESMIETWAVNGRMFVVLIHSKQNGWNIFTDGDSPKIDATLEDAERRLGLVAPESEER